MTDAYNYFEPASALAAAWGIPMRREVLSDGTPAISAKAPGLLRSPPAWRLLPLGLLILSLGLFVICGAAVGCLRDLSVEGVFAFVIGGGVCALITWLGVAALRWASAEAWGKIEIVLASGLFAFVDRGRKSRSGNLNLGR